MVHVPRNQGTPNPLGPSLDYAFDLLEKPDLFLQKMRKMDPQELQKVVNRFLYSPPESVKEALEKRGLEMAKHYEQHPDDTEKLISGYNALHTYASGFVLCLKQLLRDDRIIGDFQPIKVAQGSISTLDLEVKSKLKNLQDEQRRQEHETQVSQSRQTEVMPRPVEQPRPATDVSIAPAILPPDQEGGIRRERQSSATQSLLDKVPLPPQEFPASPSPFVHPSPAIIEPPTVEIPPAKIPAPRIEVEPQPSPTAKEVNNQRKLVTDLTGQVRELSDAMHETVARQLLDVPPASEKEIWALKDRRKILEALRDELQTRKSNFFEPSTEECQALINELERAGLEVGVYREILEIANVEGVVTLEMILKAQKSRVVETRKAIDPNLQKLLDDLETEVNQRVLDVRLRIVPAGVISFARELIAGSVDPHELQARERTVEKLIDLVREYVSG